MFQRLPQARAVLNFVLSLNLALLPALTTYSSVAFAHAGDPILPANFPVPAPQGLNPTEPLDRFQEEVNASSENSRTRPVDVFHMVDQARVSYDKNGQVSDKVSLNDYKVGLGPNGIPDLNRQLNLEVDPQTNVLRFVLSALGDKKRKPIMAHEFSNVELSSSFEDSVIRDDNFVLVSTTSGIEAIFLQGIDKTIGRAPIPRFRILTPPGLLAEGATIAKIAFAAAGETQDVYDLYGNKLERVKARDLIATVRFADGSTKNYAFDYGKDVEVPVGDQMLGYFVELMIANPNLELMPALQQIIQSPDVQEALVRYKQLRDSLLTSAHETAGSDLLNNVLVTAAQRTKLPELLKAVKPNAAGKNVFQNEAEASRDLISVMPETAEWANQLAYANENPDAKIEAIEKQAADIENGVRVTTAKRILKFWKDSPSMKFAKEYGLVTSATLLVGGLIGDGAIAEWGHTAAAHWALASVSHMYDSAINFPGLGTKILRPVLETPVNKAVSSGYFEKNWALSQWALGTSILLQFRPAGYLYAWLKYTKFQGYSDWSKEKAYYTEGLRLAGKVSNPLQRVYWLLRNQRNLYPALADGISPKTPGVRTSFFSGKKKLAAARQRINESVQKDAELKQRAMMIAAALVSQKSAETAQPMDPVLLLELLTAEQGGKITELTSSWGTIESQTAWNDLFLQVHQTLVSMGGVQDIDDDYVRDLSQDLEKLRQNYYDSLGKDPVKQNFVVKNFKNFRTLTSKYWIPYLAYGLQSYEMHLKLRHAVIDDRNARSAAHHYNTDYPFSTVLGAIAMPAEYGGFLGIFSGNFEPFTKAFMIQAEQVAAHGTMGGLDRVQTYDGAVQIIPVKSRVSKTINRDKPLGEEEGKGKPIGFIEASKAIGAAMVDPDNDAFVLKTYKNALKGLLATLQMRVGATVAPWIAGEVIIRMAENHGSSAVDAKTLAVSLIGASWGALLMRTDVWLKKNTISNTGLGYASIWPVVISAVNAMEDKAGKNAVPLKAADQLLDNGLSLKDPKLLAAGIDSMQQLYRTNAVNAYFKKPELDIQANAEMPIEELDAQARALRDFANVEPPVGTVKNMGWDWSLNFAGSVVSTAIFVTMFDTVTSMGQADLYTDLGWATGTFGATYLGLSAVNGTWKWAKKKITKFNERKTCAELLVK